jgi:WD40 repeat protein
MPSGRWMNSLDRPGSTAARQESVMSKYPIAVLLLLVGCDAPRDPAAAPGPAKSGSTVAHKPPLHAFESHVALIPVFKEFATRFAMSTDGRRFVMAGFDAKDSYDKTIIRIHDVESNGTVREFAAKFTASPPLAISSNGTRVAYAGLDAELADVESGKTRVVKRKRGGSIGSSTSPAMAFSADDSVVWTFEGKEIIALDWESGEESQAFNTGTADISAILPHSDNVHLIVGFVHGSVSLLDVTTGKSQTLDPADGVAGESAAGGGKAPAVVTMSLSGDQKWLAVARKPSGVELWNLESGEKAKSFVTGSEPCRALWLSRDGAHLIAQGQWLTPQDTINKNVDRTMPLHFIDTSNSDRIAFFRLAGDGILKTTSSGVGASGDGRLLYAGLGTGEVYVFDLAKTLESAAPSP